MKVELVESSLMENALSIIRNKATPPSMFRSYMEKIGYFLSYEISKNLPLVAYSIETPMGPANAKKLKEEIVILSILRAALPMSNAFLEQFEEASLGIVSATRGVMVEEKGRKFEIEFSYEKVPPVDDKSIIIVDPMLATGSTIIRLVDKVKESSPTRIIVCCAIASQCGVSVIEKMYPEIDLYVAAVDPELNEDGYIIPGLGDAGDRALNTVH